MTYEIICWIKAKKLTEYWKWRILYKNIYFKIGIQEKEKGTLDIAEVMEATSIQMYPHVPLPKPFSSLKIKSLKSHDLGIIRQQKCLQTSNYLLKNKY